MESLKGKIWVLMTANYRSNSKECGQKESFLNWRGWTSAARDGEH